MKLVLLDHDLPTPSQLLRHEAFRTSSIQFVHPRLRRPSGLSDDHGLSCLGLICDQTGHVDSGCEIALSAPLLPHLWPSFLNRDVPDVDLLCAADLLTGHEPDDAGYRILAGSMRRGRGALLVRAAGNHQQIHSHIGPPRPEIRVGASSPPPAERLTSYTATGAGIDIVATSSVSLRPEREEAAGFKVLHAPTSRADDSYRPFGGTSAATAIVAGVVSLMLRANPDLTWVEIRHLLRRSAVWIPGPPDRAEPRLYPRVDALGAVEAALASDLPDLWIRRSIEDNGKSRVPAEATSPDLRIDGSRLRVKVRNRGTQPSLSARLTLYGQHSTQSESPRWPEDFPWFAGAKARTATGGNQLALLDEIWFDDVPAGGEKVFTFPWPEEHLRFRDIWAVISPFDGGSIGTTLSTNHHLARIKS